MPLITLEPQHLDLHVTQGATFHYQYEYKPNGRIHSLAGYDARMGIATRPGMPLLIDLSPANGGLVLQPNNVPGVVDIYLSAPQTATLTRDSAYDLMLIAPDGTVTRALEGTVVVDRAVTPLPTVGEL